MSSTDFEDLSTRLLQRVSAGEQGAEEELYALVYDVLHGLAQRQMARQPGDHTLQPTALVHEAWLRMSGGAPLQANDRRHFLAQASRAMRCALVDHARARASLKRGAGWQRKVLDEALQLCAAQQVDVLELEEALEGLRARDPDLVRVVELRFFGGLTLEQVADVLQQPLSRTTRDWKLARIYLRSTLDGS